jgi:hypothetical protein
VIKVSPRAHRYEDRAGDPLDGLVNLFDIGIVLSVAFLLAALSSLHLDQAITKTGLHQDQPVTVKPGDQTGDVPTTGPSVIGNGTAVGRVYRLSDGRLVYVVPSTSPSGGTSSPSTPSTPSSSTAPAPSVSPTP